MATLGGMTASRKVFSRLLVGLIGVVALAAVVWVVLQLQGGDDSTRAAVPELDDLQIGGVVFSDLDNDGVLDPGEPGIADLVVRMGTRQAAPAKELTTSDDGSFAHYTGAVSVVTVSVEVLTSVPERGDAKIVAVVERQARQGEPVAIPIYDRALDCPDARGCDGLLLPDLVSLIDMPPTLNEEQQSEYPGPREWYIDTTTQPGRTLLRIATVSSNLGSGPVAVAGVVREGDRYTGSVQRIFTESLGFVDVPTELLEFHESHDHVHLNAYQELVLRDDSGVVTSGVKISFCLTDVFAAELPVPEWRPVRLDVALFDCGFSLQGINTGMTDYYGPRLPDQYLDITGVEPGVYTLDIIVDPNDLIVESDETNNVASIQIVVPAT